MPETWNWLDVKFLPAWKEQMLGGKKTCTCRYRMLGQVGDRFQQYGAVFELTQIEQMTLIEVRDQFYKEEGVLSPDEFFDVWMKIYRRWDPLKLVYLHYFKRVKE